MLFVDIF